MKYKVVQFNAAISNTQDATHLSDRIEGIINLEAESGWEFVTISQLETFKAGSVGCFGIGATPPQTITAEFIVFRQ